MAKYKSESGRSMIEMIGVLALMTLITAGAFVLINGAMRSQKISHFDDEVNLLAANARALTAEAGNFKSLPAANDLDSNNDSLGKDVATGILKKSESVISGTYKLLKTNANGTGFMVVVEGTDLDWCEGLHGRAYPNGTATCSTNSQGKHILTITFTE